jgi:K+-transporting ATPase c subunit
MTILIGAQYWVRDAQFTQTAFQHSRPHAAAGTSMYSLMESMGQMLNVASPFSANGDDDLS